MEGAIGASCIERNERTLPRAAINATNARLFELNLPAITIPDTGYSTHIKVATKIVVGEFRLRCGDAGILR
jgi:hypothetical protein